MRALRAILAGIFVGGCAAAPARPRPAVVADPAAALQRYYDERLAPVEGGYRQGKAIYTGHSLPVFYDAMGASTCAAWARSGGNFRAAGWTLAAALVGAGVGISSQAPEGDPARGAWWMSLLPAGMLGMTFEWGARGWFIQPSVALYNKQVAQMLGLQVVPEQAP
jgi:hypothetical protein